MITKNECVWRIRVLLPITNDLDYIIRLHDMLQTPITWKGTNVSTTMYSYHATDPVCQILRAFGIIRVHDLFDRGPAQLVFEITKLAEQVSVLNLDGKIYLEFPIEVEE